MHQGGPSEPSHRRYTPCAYAPAPRAALAIWPPLPLHAQRRGARLLMVRQRSAGLGVVLGSGASTETRGGAASGSALKRDRCPL